MRAARTRKTTEEAEGLNGYRSAAIIGAVLSWLTTWWFLEWVIHPEGKEQWWIVFGASIALEWALIQLKRLVHAKMKGGKGVGWAAIFVDAFIFNAGGIFDKAGRILTFPPIAAGLQLATINVYDVTTNRIGSLIVALAFGYLLSVAPLRLWRAGSA